MMMGRRTSEGGTLLLRRTNSMPRNLSRPSLNGQELLAPGSKGLSFFIRIGRLSWPPTWKLLKNFSVWPHEHLQLQSAWMSRLRTGMPSIHTGWTIAIAFILRFLLKCSRCLLQHLPTLGSAKALLHHHPTRNLVQSAATGILGSAMMTSVPSRELMSVMNVETLTEQKNKTNALPNLRGGDDNPARPNPQMTVSEMRGTHSLVGKEGVKRKNSEFPESPLFCRNFVWSCRHCNDTLSPAAATTEFAKPLPSPPESLINNPDIQATLSYLSPYIKVETPFNVDWFKNLLADHPNQPFMKSVMKGLRKGFWPFDEGEWDLKSKKFQPNYAVDDQDLAAI